MSECAKCKKTVEELRKQRADGMITGKHEKTDKTMTLCIPCFKEHYKLKRGKGVTKNIFMEK